MYIRQLRIQNLRCFEQADLDFVCPPVPAPPREIASRFGLPSLEAAPALRVPNVNLLLGDNGAGKTTVLRAVALSLLGPLMEHSGWVPYHMIRRTGDQIQPAAELLPSVRLHEQDEPRDQAHPAWDALGLLAPGVSTPNLDIGISSLQITIERRKDLEILNARRLATPGSRQLDWDDLYEDASPAFFALGYGATRRTESSESFDSSARAKSRIARYGRVAGLFEDHITLAPLSSWLPLVEDEAPERFQEIQSLFNALLPDAAELVSTKGKASSSSPRPGLAGDRGRYLFRFGKSEVPFSALSDGYRAYAGWIGDMLYHLNTACPPGMKLSDCRGVVMVDEVDLHLHPSWQRVVVDTLSETFPRLQFILSTHSPIVAGTLEAANIWVMEANEDGSVSPQRYRERIFGQSADQILTSSYFGLLTTRAPEAEAEIRALAQRAANGDPSASLEALRRLTGSIDGEDLSDSEIVVP